MRTQFLSRLGFDLDPFQRKACDALDEGLSVLVSAPTGSGKTVVADYAVARAVSEGPKGLLHDAPEGPVEPEVLRAVRSLRT